MNNLEKKDQRGIIEYLLNKEAVIDLPKPFERDIYLFDTYVAGTTHIEGIENILSYIKDGDKLVFYREPENEHDPQAIRVETLKKDKIGYVPRQDNIIFSRLMDAGKILFAKVIDKEIRGKWLKIKIKIYLHES
ncbi:MULTISPECIES: HIRAN domain-containing protein [Peptoniphilaceae]|uniref:HIRAN domain-containing protein n=1 Tax=Anaerococcus obesiensis TaxID=1287640 RepID=A0A7T7UT88_9FIRM|nr:MULTISPECIES: HIRAN domain-containing protein [Peptoniphilaceae]MBS6921614.1 HIRAN domain-containing protein [Anaerococcus vaginalis]MDU0945478.1 HIRAN domain-containing protein [Anaerococcus vaginalis]MDU1030313.1 HIRAN domain-containing protein [Anaerococcus vaginalis]MDU1763735.1 HIRAN domain-containing protein [Anaerococcus vaginalis]MDU5342573.1 HIRAN domain-containing protein [Anaerococcus vaginalis]